MRKFNTPMMQQYAAIKSEYDDCLLFFRLGDFYELFLDDAIVGAKVLDITLTKRPRGKDGHIPMAGVPYHAADGYIARLVKAGYKVAICEQVSEPNSKGIVDREVVRIVTPGTILDEKSLDKKEHNYILSLWIDENCVGMAAADVSTGDFQVTEIPIENSLEHTLSGELTRIGPTECILDQRTYSDGELLKFLSAFPGLNIYPFLEWEEYADKADRVLTDQFRVKTLEAFGIEDKPHTKRAAAALIGYLRHTSKDNLAHMRAIRTFRTHEFVSLNRSTINNLELFSTIREGEKQGSLLFVLDRTATPMGGRLLKSWLKRPLKEAGAIGDRLDAVTALLSSTSTRQEIREQLTPLYDIERILSKLSVGIGNAVNLVHLKLSLINALNIRKKLTSFDSPLLLGLAEDIPPELSEIIEFIDARIVDEPPLDTKAGGLIKAGVNEEIDRLRSQVGGGREWLAGLERTEREKTGISSLKVKYNQVFGFYIEVSKANLDNVPANYIRKQTMVNAERFITPELKDHETKILSAEERLHALEHDVFLETVVSVVMNTETLQLTASALATLDCLASFAEVAETNRYVRPKMTEGSAVDIKDGRHPVVETVIDNFVPNDVKLDSSAKDGNQLMILTGPNMAGKSVYARQVALITLMAHVGSFVPAKSATISLVDSIFVRSGAADVITAGLSTFMVEMVETAHILHHATDRSLIIMDEIGRGTSTYDGISIASAIAEYLVTNKNIAAKTIFATHYHELQALRERYPGKIENYQVLVEERKGEPVFIHKVTKGGTNSSFGVAVARLAGVPEAVTENAQKTLSTLEKKPTKNSLDKRLEKLDIDNMTPIEALETLSRLKSKRN